MSVYETLDRLVQYIYGFKYEVLAGNHFRDDTPREPDLRQFYREVLEIVDECDDVGNCIHCDRDLIISANATWDDNNEATICGSCLQDFHDKLERDD